MIIYLKVGFHNKYMILSVPFYFAKLVVFRNAKIKLLDHNSAKNGYIQDIAKRNVWKYSRKCKKE